MPTYVDESGDCGMSGRDSAPAFTLTAVWFETGALAQACEQVIAEVREKDLGVPASFEFKFSRINHSQRVAFLEALSACEFCYVACCIQKRRGGKWLVGHKWRDK